MRRKQALVVLAAFLMPTGLVLAGSFKWTGDGGQANDWDNCDNWFCTGCGAFSQCFPGNSDDDVKILGDDETVTLVEASEEIEDLTLQGIFEFTGGSSQTTRELVAESLVINGTGFGTTIDVQGNARLVGS